LVVVDENKKVKGIVSLSDLLNFIIVKPMELGLDAVTVGEAASRSPGSAPVEMLPIPMQTGEANS